MGQQHLIYQLGSIPAISGDVAWRHKSLLDDTPVSPFPLSTRITVLFRTVSVCAYGIQLTDEIFKTFFQFHNVLS